jgi:RNA dependent RNA polymerase
MVPYGCGLPVGNEECLNMLLDAGFEPKRLHFMKDLALKAFENKCIDLQKKLNITVGKSTYAYMVPDFSGVLEPNEVFIDFSTFADSVSGFAGTLLNGVDILVARSPAHYGSDIQKVKAVFKIELIGLKDVIVFSTKGNPSLAAKLSGGDYDGDIAVSVYQVHISSSKMCATVLGDATVQNLIFILASAPATNTDSKKL